MIWNVRLVGSEDKKRKMIHVHLFVTAVGLVESPQPIWCFIAKSVKQGIWNLVLRFCVIFEHLRPIQRPHHWAQTCMHMKTRAVSYIIFIHCPLGCKPWTNMPSAILPWLSLHLASLFSLYFPSLDLFPPSSILSILSPFSHLHVLLSTTFMTMLKSACPPLLPFTFYASVW